jgi:hypothetical protein
MSQLQPTFASDEEKAAYEAGRTRLTEVQKKLAQLSQRPVPETDDDRKERERTEQSLIDDYRKLYEKFGAQYEYHGWVWLFLRKAASR